MSLLRVLVDAAIRGLLLAMLAGAVMTLLRVRAAEARLRLWTWVLYAALAMPLLVAVTPRWTIPLRVLPPKLPVVEAVAPANPVPAMSSLQVGAGNLMAVPEAEVQSVPPPRQIEIPWPVTLYGFLAGVLLVRLGIGLVWARRLRRRARPLSTTATPALHGAPYEVDVAESDAVTVPAMFGIRHPVIVLPSDWRLWDSPTLNAVLRHEAAHARRGDTLTQRLALLYEALCWFSPLAWWLPVQLTALAEEASDAAVLAEGAEPIGYAEILIGFLRRCENRPRVQWHEVGMARGARSTKRLEKILQWKGGATMVISKRLLWLSAAVIVPGALVMAAVHPEMARRTAPAVPHQSAARVPAPAALPTVPTVPVPAAPATLPVVPSLPSQAAPPNAALPSSPPSAASGEAKEVQGTTPQVGGVVEEPKCVSCPPIVSNGWSGHVNALFVIAADGSVSAIQAGRRSPDQAPDQLNVPDDVLKAVSEGVKNWRFDPEIFEGRPVQVLATMSVAVVSAPAADIAASQDPQTLAPVRVSGDVQASKCISCPAPAYPRMAQQAHIGGAVVFNATIGTDGLIKHLELVSGNGILAGPTKPVVMGWRYQPTTLDGVPVEVETTITVNFNFGGELAQAPVNGTNTREEMPPCVSCPAIASKDNDWGGRVTVNLTIAVDGSVIDATVASGQDALPAPVADAVLTGVRNWRFRPTIRDGSPVQVNVTRFVQVSSPLQTATPKRTTVGGDVQASKCLACPQPRYPLEAQQEHVSGAVIFKATIGTDGLIKNLELVSGNAILADPTKEVVSGWRYAPTFLDGVPVEVETTITVSFNFGGNVMQQQVIPDPAVNEYIHRLAQNLGNAEGTLPFTYRVLLDGPASGQ